MARRMQRDDEEPYLIKLSLSEEPTDPEREPLSDDGQATVARSLAREATLRRELGRSKLQTPQ
ncbi:MAG: hypothetical protein D6790_21440, partial [Caldilineae bacterium]